VRAGAALPGGVDEVHRPPSRAQTARFTAADVPRFAPGREATPIGRARTVRVRGVARVNDACGERGAASCGRELPFLELFLECIEGAVEDLDDIA